MAKIFNIGIVGFGKRSKDGLCKSMRNYAAIEGNDGFRVVAIADIRPEEELRAGLEEIGFGDARIYKTPEEMYENEKLDGVIIGTRCSLHTKMAVINAKYGIPVLLEKPVATTEEELEQLRAICPEMDHKTVVSFPLRCSPLALKVKEIIDSGILGKISQLQAINNVPYARCYYHEWYHDDKETGGLFLQKSTHDLDLLSFLMNDTIKPVMISATESKLIFKGDMPAGLRCRDCDKMDTCPESTKNVASYGEKTPDDHCCFAVDTGNHDSASIMVQYEGGLHAIYSQNFVARKGAGRRGVRIIGYNATVEFDFNTKCIDLFYHNEDKHEHIDMKEQCATSHGGGDLIMVRAFVNIMEGKKSTTPLSLGILSAHLCLAARKSAEEHVFVRV